jgi:hypothetical protein
MPQFGIGLDQRLFERPVVPVVEPIPRSELAVVIEHPIEQARDEGADLVADAGPVAAGGGDHPQERVVALAGAGLDHVIDGARLVRVQLVDAAEVDVQAIEGGTFGGERLELRAAGQHVNVVRPDAHPEAAPEAGRLAGHRLRIAKHDARLVAGRGQRIHLGAAFAVGGDCRCRAALRYRRGESAACHRASPSRRRWSG